MINKLQLAKIKTVTRIPLILCFKLLGVSLGKVKSAPRAMISPVCKSPRYEKSNTGITAESAAFRALVKLLPRVKSFIFVIILLGLDDKGKNCVILSEINRLDF